MRVHINNMNVYTIILGSGYARLELGSNKFKRFESGVFQSVLVSLKGNNNDYNSYYANINGGKFLTFLVIKVMKFFLQNKHWLFCYYYRSDRLYN